MSRVLERIDDYASGAMSDEDASALEEEMFEGAHAAELSFLDRLARWGRHLDGRKTFRIGATKKELDALAASGVRVQYLDIGRPGTVEVRFDFDCDVFVSKLDAGLHGVDHVDIEVELPGHGILKTFRDVRVDPEDGAIYGACERELAEIAYGVGRAIQRIVVARDGRREVAAVYDITRVG